MAVTSTTFDPISFGINQSFGAGPTSLHSDAVSTALKGTVMANSVLNSGTVPMAGKGNFGKLDGTRVSRDSKPSETPVNEVSGSVSVTGTASTDGSGSITVTGTINFGKSNPK